jgi:hypothetical protein
VKILLDKHNGGAYNKVVISGRNHSSNTFYTKKAADLKFILSSAKFINKEGNLGKKIVHFLQKI